MSQRIDIIGIHRIDKSNVTPPHFKDFIVPQGYIEFRVTSPANDPEWSFGDAEKWVGGFREKQPRARMMTSMEIITLIDLKVLREGMLSFWSGEHPFVFLGRSGEIKGMSSPDDIDTHVRIITSVRP